MSVSVGNRKHWLAPKLAASRSLPGFWALSNNPNCLFVSPAEKTIHKDYPSWQKAEGRVLWIFLLHDPTHRKNFVSSHSHASYLTDVGDVKNSEIRIERDCLKHLKRKFEVAVTIFILVTKLNGFKYPINITSDLNHSSSLYLSLHILCTVVILVVVEAKY